MATPHGAEPGSLWRASKNRWHQQSTRRLEACAFVRLVSRVLIATWVHRLDVLYLACKPRTAARHTSRRLKPRTNQDHAAELRRTALAKMAESRNQSVARLTE
jgi:hypothetical protein